MKTFWIVKQEPDNYPFEQLVADKRTDWTGVRNYQARNLLRRMQIGDVIFYYHSGKDKCVYGIARVTKSAFPDPTDTDWVAVEIEAVRKLVSSVSLARIKENPALANLQLLKQSRLSVSEVSEAEFNEIIRMAGDDFRG